jgi:hypothetical protein
VGIIVADGATVEAMTGLSLRARAPAAHVTRGQQRTGVRVTGRNLRDRLVQRHITCAGRSLVMPISRV